MTPHMKNYDEFMYFKNMKNNHFKIKGNVLGNPDAEVVVYEYSDFECPENGWYYSFWHYG